MIKVERIEEWRGESVIDSHGESVGKIDEIYFDARSGNALLLSLKSGLMGRHSRLAPVEGASVSRSYLRLAHTKEQVQAALELRGEAAIDDAALEQVESAYGVKLPDELELWSASEMEAHRAAAEAARAKADQLERDAQSKLAEHEAAKQHAQGASENADAAERAAAEAREAALEARRQADQFGS